MDSIRESALEIQKAFRIVEIHWAILSQQWKDRPKRHFEEEYLHPILTETPELINQIQEVSHVFAQVRREVE